MKIKTKNYTFHFPHLLLIILGFSAFYFNAAAQQLKYTYDAAGNRVLRELVLIRMVPELKNTPEEKVGKLVMEREISLMPNPTRGLLSINISNITPENRLIFQLFSSEGALLQRMDAAPFESPYSMDLSSYSTGWYMLTIWIDEENHQFKVLKQ